MAASSEGSDEEPITFSRWCDKKYTKMYSHNEFLKKESPQLGWRVTHKLEKKKSPHLASTLTRENASTEATIGTPQNHIMGNSTSSITSTARSPCTTCKNMAQISDVDSESSEQPSHFWKRSHNDIDLHQDQPKPTRSHTKFEERSKGARSSRHNQNQNNSFYAGDKPFQKTLRSDYSKVIAQGDWITPKNQKNRITADPESTDKRVVQIVVKESGTRSDSSQKMHQVSDSVDQQDIIITSESKLRTKSKKSMKKKKWKECISGSEASHDGKNSKEDQKVNAAFGNVKLKREKDSKEHIENSPDVLPNASILELFEEQKVIFKKRKHHNKQSRTPTSRIALIPADAYSTKIESRRQESDLGSTNEKQTLDRTTSGRGAPMCKLGKERADNDLHKPVEFVGNGITSSKENNVKHSIQSGKVISEKDGSPGSCLLQGEGKNQCLAREKTWSKYTERSKTKPRKLQSRSVHLERIYRTFDEDDHGRSDVSGYEHSGDISAIKKESKLEAIQESNLDGKPDEHAPSEKCKKEVDIEKSSSSKSQILKAEQCDPTKTLTAKMNLVEAWLDSNNTWQESTTGSNHSKVLSADSTNEKRDLEPGELSQDGSSDENWEQMVNNIVNGKHTVTKYQYSNGMLEGCPLSCPAKAVFKSPAVNLKPWLNRVPSTVSTVSPYCVHPKASMQRIQSARWSGQHGMFKRSPGEYPRNSLGDLKSNTSEATFQTPPRFARQRQPTKDRGSKKTCKTSSDRILLHQPTSVDTSSVEYQTCSSTNRTTGTITPSRFQPRIKPSSRRTQQRHQDTPELVKNEAVVIFPVSTMPYIDTHCHIDFLYQRSEFCGTFKKYSKTHHFPGNYAGCVAVFCTPVGFQRGALWEDLVCEDNIWAAFGCHPHYAKSYDGIVEENIIRCLKHPKAVALGEIGLDYSSRCTSDRPLQMQVFRRQLQIALHLGKPLVIHSRDAELDTLSIMVQVVPKTYRIHRHCFTGTAQEARSFFLAFPNSFIGLTALVTFPTAYSVHRTATEIPLNKLLLETDAPYFLPKQCPRHMRWANPSMAVFVAERIAQLKELPLDDVLRAVRRNTQKMYGI